MGIRKIISSSQKLKESEDEANHPPVYADNKLAETKNEMWSMQIIFESRHQGSSVHP